MACSKVLIIEGVAVTAQELIQYDPNILDIEKYINTDGYIITQNIEYIKEVFGKWDLEIFNYSCCSKNTTNNKETTIFIVGKKVKEYKRQDVSCNNCQSVDHQCDKCFGMTENGWYDVNTIDQIRYDNNPVLHDFIPKVITVPLFRICEYCHGDNREEIETKCKFCKKINRKDTRRHNYSILEQTFKRPVQYYLLLDFCLSCS